MKRRAGIAFPSNRPHVPCNANGDSGLPGAAFAEAPALRQAELEAEVAQLRTERERVTQLSVQLQQGLTRLDQDRAALQQQQVLPLC